jgi:TPR repeat protein
VGWYEKAAEWGHSSAHCNLGLCYCKGEGVDQDETQAVDWFMQAAEHGHSGAQFQLGVCYEQGVGVRHDEAEAVECYRKAAEDEQGRTASFMRSTIKYYGLVSFIGRDKEPQASAVVAFWAARPRLRRGSSRRSRSACAPSTLRSRAVGVEQDDTDAARWREAAKLADFFHATQTAGALTLFIDLRTERVKELDGDWRTLW